MNNKTSYFNQLLKHKRKTELIQEIKEAPLKENDAEFLIDCILKLSYKDMENKYNLTKDGVYKKKLRCIEKLSSFLFYQD